MNAIWNYFGVFKTLNLKTSIHLFTYELKYDLNRVDFIISIAHRASVFAFLTKVYYAGRQDR